MDWAKLMKEDKLKNGYKYVANLAQRIAYNLGNTASQTEVKIISCIPIDVTDLHRRIFELEMELDKAIQERKNSEMVAKTLVPKPMPLCSEVPTLRELNYPVLSSCKCFGVPVSVSCGDPVVVFNKENNRKTRKETPIKFIKRPFNKSFGSFYKESGMGHGDRLRDNASKERSDGRNNGVVNIDYRHLEPVQYCHVESAQLLNPSPGRQSLDMIKNEKNTFLETRSVQPTGAQMTTEHNYLEPIAECCRLEATMAFHRIESFTELQTGDTNGDKLLKNPSSVYQHGEPAPEVRNLTTTYDWCSTDAKTRQPQAENIREGGEPISQAKSRGPNTSSVKNLFITECVNPHNIFKQSQQDSITESQNIEATFASLGLPNTEPKRVKIPTYYSSQEIKQSQQVINTTSELNKRRGLSPTLSCNQETQAPTIDSCSCCFFKQLTAEQLLNMPRGPLRRYLHNYQQTSSSLETCADCNHLYEQKGMTRRRRNANKIKKPEFANSAKKQQDKITNSFLDGIVTKYAPSTMQSSSSQYSAPVCRDEDSDSCSCCAGGVFYDIDLVNCQPKLDNFVHTSDSSNQQYYDDTLYDLIPVKENSKRTKSDKKEIEKCRQRSHLSRNDVIVNYHTLHHNKLKKNTMPIDISNKNNVDYMRNARQKIIPRSNYPVSKNQPKLKPHNTKRMETSCEPNTNHMECQTELHLETAENKETQPPEKHEDALSQIKQTLQFVLDRFRPHTHRDPCKKDAIMQVENCQCDQNYRIPYNETFMINQTKPTFIHCPQVTPASFVYPTMPILTSPWINDGAMFVQPKRRPHHQTKSQDKYKSSFGVGMSILQEESFPIPERNEQVGDGKDESFKNNICNDKPYKKFADICEQTDEQTNLSTNDVKPQGLIHTIIISSTNITKKYKNKKIYCCISKQQSIKHLNKPDDLKYNNMLNEEPGPNEIIKNAKYTGSTVKEVIEELNKMEEYITRSEYRIGDVTSSKGSLKKPQKKFTNMFRNIKKVFKTRSKNKKIVNRMSCDNMAEDEAKGFCVSSVHLLYPTKQKFPFTCKRNRFNDIPLMSEQYSYTDLHSKKCRQAVLSSRKRRSRRIKL